MSDVEPEQDTPLEEPEQPDVPDAPDEEEAAEEAEQPAELEPEPAPEQPSDEDREALAKALNTRFMSYQKSVESKLGDEVTDWLLCPLCASGMAPGFMNRHDLGHVPEDVQANVQMFLGFARETEYEQDPNTHTCDTCGGKTKVRSGAVAGEYITRTCPGCNGYGFQPPPGLTTGGNGHPVTPEASVTAALADLDTPERDNWGEPRVLPDKTLNDNFGKMPQFKSVHPVYGVTANLSPEELALG